MVLGGFRSFHVLVNTYGKYVANIIHFCVNKFFFISFRRKTAIS